MAASSREKYEVVLKVRPVRLAKSYLDSLLTTIKNVYMRPPQYHQILIMIQLLSRPLYFIIVKERGEGGRGGVRCQACLQKPNPRDQSEVTTI